MAKKIEEAVQVEADAPQRVPTAPKTVKVKVTDERFKRGHDFVKVGTVIDCTPGEAHSMVVNKHGELVK
jgi:hypothetical protein